MGFQFPQQINQPALRRDAGHVRVRLLRPGKVVSRTISLEETSGVLAAMGSTPNTCLSTSRGATTRLR